MSCLTHPCGLTSHRTEPRLRREPTLTPVQVRASRNRLIWELHRGTTVHYRGPMPVRLIGGMFGLSDRAVYDAIAEVKALFSAIAETADAL